jgi:hypothetical protein
MAITEEEIDRWLERGGKFFKAVARNPMVRGALLARGLTDEELAQGWRLYSDLNGFGGESGAQAATPQTAAAQALNQLDAWDAPNFNAARAVLDAHHPEASRFLFENLAPAVGPAAAAGVGLLLDRVGALRDGKAKGVSPEQGRAAVELLAQRKIVDAAREAELRALIDAVKRGARPEELMAAAERDPRKVEVAEAFVRWLREWREIARIAIARRDYRISLGLAQRRRPGTDDEGDDATTPSAEV